ncbi:MAG: cysteine hydrolase [Acetobacteraceae bacterium]|nr:cysteine hydrolase [Acetobacteraceae bacterium]
MTNIPTLRTLSGLPTAPAPLSRSALVMIDCQNTYREGVMRLAGVEEALAEAQRMLERARAVGIPVVHIRHAAGTGTPYDVRAPIGQIADAVAPRGDEPVITKAYPNSFHQTELQDVLARHGFAPGASASLVLAGFMTHMCVNSTARGAFSLGYAPTLVAAATATRDLPGVAAPALQAASLAALADLFAVVVERAEDIPDHAREG